MYHPCFTLGHWMVYDMNYQSDCLCGGECQKPCIAIRQIKAEQDMAMTEHEQVTERLAEVKRQRIKMYLEVISPLDAEIVYLESKAIDLYNKELQA